MIFFFSFFFWYSMKKKFIVFLRWKKKKLAIFLKQYQLSHFIFVTHKISNRVPDKMLCYPIQLMSIFSMCYESYEKKRTWYATLLFLGGQLVTRLMEKKEANCAQVVKNSVLQAHTQVNLTWASKWMVLLHLQKLS